MKSIKPRQVIRVLEEKGFSFVRQKGSHRLYRKGDLRVTVPYHNKDLKPGTLQSILRQSGIKKKNFKKSHHVSLTHPRHGYMGIH